MLLKHQKFDITVGAFENAAVFEGARSAMLKRSVAETLYREGSDRQCRILRRDVVLSSLSPIAASVMPGAL